MDEQRIAIFKQKSIRKVIYKNEWWFSVVDVVFALTDSSIPRRYWSDLKIKLTKEGFAELYEKIVQLKLVSIDGKSYETDCANTETVFRIIEAIPSPKAEPFKRWLIIESREKLESITGRKVSTPANYLSLKSTKKIK